MFLIARIFVSLSIPALVLQHPQSAVLEAAQSVRRATENQSDDRRSKGKSSWRGRSDTVGKLHSVRGSSAWRARSVFASRRKSLAHDCSFPIAPERGRDRFYTDLRRAKNFKRRDGQTRQEVSKIPGAVNAGFSVVVVFAFWHPHPLFSQLR